MKRLQCTYWFRHRSFNAGLFCFLIALFSVLQSCNTVKRVKDGQHLLTENKIVVDGKVSNKERVNNIPVQKPNNTFLPIGNFPLRLHIYNLARPNIDSILQEKVYSDSAKVKRKINLLSEKQFEREMQSRKNFNAWLKRTGEAPVIVDDTKTEKSSNRLRAYYFQRGFFNNEVDYEIKRDSNKKAQVTYTVTRNAGYKMDSLETFIETPIIDSLYNANKADSNIKIGKQYDEADFEAERTRINRVMRNNGVYHFGQEYVSFELDTVGRNKKFKTDLIIDNRRIRNQDTTIREPFKMYKIKDVNIFTDYTYENQVDSEITDSISFNDYNLYSFDEMKFRPKALTDAVFIHKGDLYRDIDRTRTSRFINQLQMFNFPSVEYVENPQDTTLTANIYLSPRKKYSLGVSFDVSQSNIQTVGFAFSTGLKIRNVFRGAETLDISALGSIGASKDNRDENDPFFDINEFGGTIGLTIPRFYLPFDVDNIVPKYMSPTTKINISATSQQNIGLDKQTLSSVFAYQWNPSDKVYNGLELFNIQYVRNLNVGNYFGVYRNSFNRLNAIAQNIGEIGPDEELQNPPESTEPRFQPANDFISDVLNGNTSLTSTDQDFITVNNIDQRKDRLTENNLIVSSSFDYRLDKREGIFDNNFSTFKWHVELAGNLLSGISSFTGAEKDDEGRYEILGVAFSQYFKTELDYIKYFEMGRKSVLATRSYFGIAIPFGNSNSIPFAESFFGGGPNDNRAWTAYNLGPGSSSTINEFSEANLKLHFSVEQRFNIFGQFNGAIFVDAGNIWNVFDNVDDEPSVFGGLKSLRDIAVGSGFGLRYDFTYFVIRGDIGFKTYNPERPLGERWFKEYNFQNAVFNIGINYPF
ncbi:BamA/TamA family outer membrane protein [Winogradskyella maritima]|uniref:POTRA domain-containing protein n=1 Tax=Winogradskyella maritima TaxID=1517766 RepID=A0ABV8AFN5_9FLAO|nr:BamA/TamA family outer membrane protein [Winogradskyella maritima]